MSDKTIKVDPRPPYVLAFYESEYMRCVEVSHRVPQGKTERSMYLSEPQVRAMITDLHGMLAKYFPTTP